MSLQIEEKYQSTIPQKKPVAKKDSTPAAIKIVQNRTEVIGDTIKTSNGVKIPAEVDKQLDIIYKKGIADLENMPLWLKLLGGNKVKNDFIKLIGTEKFKKDMTTIMTDAKAKSTKANKDVIELLKEPGVIDKVFNCLGSSSQKGTLLHFVLSSSIVKEKFSENIKKDQHKYLLYGKS